MDSISVSYVDTAAIAGSGITLEIIMGYPFVGGADAGTDVILFATFGAGGENPFHLNSYRLGFLFVAVRASEVEGGVRVIIVIGDYGHDTCVAKGSGALLSVDGLTVVMQSLFVRGNIVAPRAREEMYEDTFIFDEDVYRSLRDLYLRFLFAGNEEDEQEKIKRLFH